MNLKQIRELFRDLSGRFDLVPINGEDRGANFYINEGSKWLDRRLNVDKANAIFPSIITPGTWYKRFQLARAVKEVWFISSEGRIQLEKAPYQEILGQVLTGLPTSWTAGTPYYYSPVFIRLIPEDITPATIADLAEYIGVVTPGNDYNAIILSAPIDIEGVLEIHGLFYSYPLLLDTDENFWSTVHPMLLVQASVLQIYTTSGNRIMKKSYQEDLYAELREIDMDFVEQQISEVSQMEG